MYTLLIVLHIARMPGYMLQEIGPLTGAQCASLDYIEPDPDTTGPRCVKDYHDSVLSHPTDGSAPCQNVKVRFLTLSDEGPNPVAVLWKCPPIRQ